MEQDVPHNFQKVVKAFDIFLHIFKISGTFLKSLLADHDVVIGQYILKTYLEKSIRLK